MSYRFGEIEAAFDQKSQAEIILRENNLTNRRIERPNLEQCAGWSQRGFQGWARKLDKKRFVRAGDRERGESLISLILLHGKAQ